VLAAFPPLYPPDFFEEDFFLAPVDQIVVTFPVKEEGAMRTLLLFALLAQLVAVPDVVQPDRTRITKDGVTVGTVKPDFLIKGHYRVYDRKGNRVGTVKQDFLYPDRYRVEKFERVK
jgi:hypothetical protein